MFAFLTSPDAYVVLALTQAIVYLLLFRFLDLYEREPLVLVALLALSGATLAIALARAGNDLVLGMLPEKVEAAYGPAFAAPIEELVKALTLVVAFVVSYGLSVRFGWLEFEGVTDGIVYGAAVGLGFAFAEDLGYLLDNPVSGFLDYRERVDLFGPTTLAHATYSATFGAGLGVATWLRRSGWRIGAPVLGFILATVMHAVHNGLTPTVMTAKFGVDDYLRFRQPSPSNPNPFWDPSRVPRTQGDDMIRVQRAVDEVVADADHVFIGFVLIGIALWLAHQRAVIRRELAEEVNGGLLSRGELEVLGTYWRRSLLYWRLLLHGRTEQWRSTRRLHNELVDFAFLKWRARALSGASDAKARFGRCRRRIARLQGLERAA